MKEIRFDKQNGLPERSDISPEDRAFMKMAIETNSHRRKPRNA